MPHDTVMKHKGFHASVMEAERLEGNQTFGLPPGTALPVYRSEIFKEYPEAWMRGPGVFIVPVVPNKGLWFNWTMNDAANTAVLPTVKGCNPVTGLQTSGFHLERYENKCPKHNVEFGPDRYCDKCGYKWPAQNYVCQAPLWWDGWRAEDGTVRQFFFTEDEVRDIASKMIGKQNTVPAFGFAFYRPKVERPKQYGSLRSYMHYQFPKNAIYEHKLVLDSWTYTNTGDTKNTFMADASPKYFLGDNVEGYEVKALNCSSSEEPIIGAAPTAGTSSVGAQPRKRIRSDDPDRILRSRSVKFTAQVRQTEAPKKEVAVGAGAKIRQGLEEDPYPLDTWKDKPDSVMTIYFVFKEQVDKMLEAGTVEVEEQGDGMLKDLPVG